ncbi:MAG: hypothetical protein ACT4PU_04175 [Planctomycetota bacterium]
MAGGNGEIALSSEFPIRVAARAPGFAPNEVRVEELPDVPVVLTLGPETVLSGRVVWLDGSSASSQTIDRVVAVPLREFINGQEPVEDSPYVRMAAIGFEGWFGLTELDPATNYRVLAAGRGVITVDAPTVSRFDRPVTVTVGRLFASKVSLIDSSTRHALRAARGSFGSSGQFLRPLTSAKLAKPVHPSDLDLSLAGLHLGGDSPLGWDVSLWAYAGSQNDLELGPFEMSVDIPGYEPTRAQFQMPWTGRGLGELEIACEPSVNRWGSLLLELANTQQCPPTLKSPYGVLLLHPSMEHAPLGQRHFEVGLSYPDSSGRIFVGSLPEGDYTSSLRLLPLKHTLVASGSFSIRQGTESLLKFDLAGLAALQVEVLDSHARHFEGPLTLEMIPEGQAPGLAGRFVAFKQGPYIVPNVPPGSWTARTSAILPLDQGWKLEGRATLGAGDFGFLTLSR